MACVVLSQIIFKKKYFDLIRYSLLHLRVLFSFIQIRV